MLYVTGEYIEAGDSVVISMTDGKAYVAGPVAGTLLGVAVESCREGFRIIEKDGEIREDDA